MPHIVVDYSDPLPASFDHRAFALELHELAAETVQTTVDTCKTRFRRIEEVVIADGAPGQALIHVEVALLPGRPAQDKTRLSRAVIELVLRHTARVSDTVIHASADVRDLGEAYIKHVSTP
ncbi:5-carboxymethyl-2-hydroxymuconate Delta-isomerase [Streptomyces sp. NPDC002990]